MIYDTARDAHDDSAVHFAFQVWRLAYPHYRKLTTQRIMKLPSKCKIQNTSVTTRSHSGFTVILGVYRAFNGQYVYLNAHIIISWKTKMFPWRGHLAFGARGTVRDSLRNAHSILITQPSVGRKFTRNVLMYFDGR